MILMGVTDTLTDARLSQVGPASVAWRIHRERIMLLSWGRAIALQFAHPKVAAGVAQHSAFGGSSMENRARLHRTLQAMLDLTFGDTARATTAADRIDTIHGWVTGRLTESVGAHASGAPYAARDPELLLWVFATMLDSSLLVFERFVAPLTPAERDRYCAESRLIGPLLRLPAEMIPDSHAALVAYMQGMIDSKQVAVGPTARRLLRQLLEAKPVVLTPAPVLTLLHLPTVGLLPERLRRDYGLRWTSRHARALDLTMTFSRRLLPWLPPIVRYWPIARAAYRDVVVPDRGLE
jgi:uncharacterized protein (DUF2236 family)